MYTADSFLTLSTSGQIGLAGLSAVLAIGMLMLTRRVTRSMQIALRIGTAILLFGAFEWLSPQIYYAYYWAIIPGLPVQSVISIVPDVLSSAEILFFSGPRTLSAHGRGALAWMMVIAAALQPRR